MKIIDLSHILNNNTTIYPGTAPPRIKPSNTIDKDGFREKELHFCSHFGTHIDAPAHILENGKTLDEFNIDKFVGRAILIDIRGKDKIEVDDLKKAINGKDIQFIIFRTGYEQYWKESKYFKAFPILTRASSEFLASLSLKGVGFDCISPDPVGDVELINHKILLGSETLIIENLCNLESIANLAEFKFYGMPLKLEDGDGSPIRAVAIID